MGNIHVVGPNKALLISGSGRREPRVVVGGRAFVPFLTQRCDSLSLELRTIIVESKRSATVQGVMVSVTGVCQVKISGFKEVTNEDGTKILEKDVHALLLAGQHFIGQSDNDIEHAVSSTLEGHQRSILGTLTVEELSKDRSMFSARVRDLAKEDLRSMGMELVSYTIASLTDEDGYLDSLGVSQTANVKRLAEVGRSVNLNETKQQQAEQELKNQKSKSTKPRKRLKSRLGMSWFPKRKFVRKCTLQKRAPMPPNCLRRPSSSKLLSRKKPSKPL